MKGQKTGGRRIGSVNKNTKLVKDVFATVFNDLQTDPKAKLKAWAKKNPTEFYKLASKLIPIQLAGDPENPLQHKHEVIFKRMKNDSNTDVQ